MSQQFNTVSRVDLKLTFLANRVLRANLKEKKIEQIQANKLGRVNNKSNPGPKSRNIQTRILNKMAKKRANTTIIGNAAKDV